MSLTQPAEDPVATKVLHEGAMETVEKVYLRRHRPLGCHTVKSLPRLQISPVAATPHKSRLFRMISKLSFSLKVQDQEVTAIQRGH